MYLNVLNCSMVGVVYYDSGFKTQRFPGTDR